MVVANEQAQLKKILSDTIPLLCKSGLGLFNESFSVEAVVGITINETDVLLINFKEIVLPDGTTVSHSWQKASCEEEDIDTDNRRETKKKTSAYNDGNRKEQFTAAASATNVILESPNEEQCVYRQTSVPELVETVCSWNDDINEQATYSCQTTGPQHCDAEEYGFTIEPVDWRSQQKSFCSNEAEGIDCGIIKVEKQEMEEGFDLDFSVKNVPEDNIGADTRRISNSSQRYQRRKVVGGCRKMVPRTGLPFSQKHLQAKKYPNLVNRPGHSRASYLPGMQTWANEALSSQATSQEADTCNDVMIDVLCRDVVQQSTVTAERQFICHICHATLSNPNNLMAHIKGTHLALNRYQCNLCLEKFRWYMQLHRHRKRCHADAFPP